MLSNTVQQPPCGWRLLYFNAPTRGEQVRMLFNAASTPFEDERLDFPKGLDQYKHATLGDNSPLMFDQCPTVQTPEGASVSQTACVMQFVGNRLGLGPQASEDSIEAKTAADARALSLTLYSEELRNGVFYKMLLPLVAPNFIRYKLGACCGGCLGCLIGCVWGWWAGVKKHSANFAKKFAPKLESALRTNGGGEFFCGEKMCYADVALYDCVESILSFDMLSREKELQQFPKLSAWMLKMEAVPELQDYLSKRLPVCDAIIETLREK